MNINLKVRMKNPWFWIGVIGVLLTALGISPEIFTSWGAVLDALLAFISNPYKIGCAVIAVLGIFIDPTTAGITDSKQALTYTAPKKKE